MKIKLKPKAPSITEGAVFAAITDAGINGITSRQLNALLKGQTARVTRALLNQRKVRTEWTPSPDHPYALQEARWWVR